MLSGVFSWDFINGALWRIAAVDLAAETGGARQIQCKSLLELALAADYKLLTL
jgi:hypothetical protein